MRLCASIYKAYKNAIKIGCRSATCKHHTYSQEITKHGRAHTDVFLKICSYLLPPEKKGKKIRLFLEDFFFQQKNKSNFL